MNGQYIKRIEIEALWNGHKHICWDLKPGVNILSGVNGVGKSTILTRAILAGADILCLSNNGDAYDPEIAAKAIDIITEKVKDGTIPEKRIHESYERIMTLKKSLKF